mmetsp:Transcript_28330/g.74724  ORF Transcript_28330/g.74724 Transcript_28330/m.74724 type:complete len:157 (-) Transcript_28330:26-496(-)
MLDRDHTGKIDAHKLVDALRAVGRCMSDAEAQDLVARFGADTEFGFDDYCVMMGCPNGNSTPGEPQSLEGYGSEELHAAFECFDSQHSGHFDKAQLKDMLRRLNVIATDEEVEQMFSIGDKNHDGMIDFSDFQALMATHYSVIKAPSSMSLDAAEA